MPELLNAEVADVLYVIRLRRQEVIRLLAAWQKTEITYDPDALREDIDYLTNEFIPFLKVLVDYDA